MSSYIATWQIHGPDCASICESFLGESLAEYVGKQLVVTKERSIVVKKIIEVEKLYPSDFNLNVAFPTRDAKLAENV